MFHSIYTTLTDVIRKELDIDKARLEWRDHWIKTALQFEWVNPDWDVEISIKDDPDAPDIVWHFLHDMSFERALEVGLLKEKLRYDRDLKEREALDIVRMLKVLSPRQSDEPAPSEQAILNAKREKKEAELDRLIALGRARQSFVD